jgi:hypothetical protein
MRLKDEYNAVARPEFSQAKSVVLNRFGDFEDPSRILHREAVRDVSFTGDPFGQVACGRN